MRRLGGMKQCPCGNDFYCRPSKAHRARYCSNACKYRFRVRPRGLKYQIRVVNKAWFKGKYAVSMETLLVELDYVPEDDSWETDGRRTYTHEEDATAAYLRVLKRQLPAGWLPSSTAIRTFVNAEAGEMIEIEPGGSDCQGHLLHHMRLDHVA